MIIKSADRRKIAIALICVFISLILCGIGIGVYFIVKDRSGFGGLSRRQVSFGIAINNSTKAPQVSYVNFEDVLKDYSENSVIAYSDEFVGISDGEQIRFISTASKSLKALSLEFDELLAIVSNVAIVQNGLNKEIVDIENDREICIFSNATYQVSGNYIFIKTSQKDYFQVNQNNSILNVSCLCLNAKTGEIVYKDRVLDSVIEAQIFDNFFYVFSKHHTTVFSLSNNFEKVCEFENIGLESDNAFNVQSVVENESYKFDEFYRISELSARALLVEKTFLCAEENAKIEGTLSDGSKVFYQIDYQILDVKTNQAHEIQTDSVVVRSEKIDLAPEYVAIVMTNINRNCQPIDNDMIYYMVLEDGLKNRKVSSSLHEIVSYDLQKYGRISNFSNKRLYTTGGNASGYVSFKGEEENSQAKKSVEKIVQTSASGNMFVFQSINGLYGIRDSKQIIFHSTFDKISPIVSSRVIAKQGEKYFLIDEYKNSKQIVNFASEFEEWILAGIGYYLTKNLNGTYNVYDYDQKLCYENVFVSFSEAQNKIFMFVGTDKVFEIQHTSKQAGGNLQIANDLSIFKVKAFSPVLYAVSDILEGEQLSPSEILVDEVTGAGYANFLSSFEEHELNQKLSTYSNLSNKQKALIPSFDDISLCSYKVGEGENEVWFDFVGAHFLVYQNIAVAILKLQKRGTNEYRYIVNIALKDSYLVDASVVSINQTEESNFAWFENGMKSAQAFQTTKSVSGKSLSGEFGLFESLTSRNSQCDYQSAGYDGGMLFASNVADGLNFNIKLSNIFVQNALSLEGESFSGHDDGDVIDYGNFVVTILKTGTTRKLLVKAKMGYAFKQINFVAFDKISVAKNDELHLVAKLTQYASSVVVDYSNESCDYFALQDVEIIEQYSRLILNDEHGSLSDSKTYYFFYGYANNISSNRNPAPYGFKDFVRNQNVGVFTKKGHSFDGYTLNVGGEDKKVIDKDQNFIADLEWFDQTKPGLQSFDLQVCFAPNPYKISYKNSGILLTDQTDVVFGEKVGTLLDPLQKEGYDFMGWYYGDTKISFDTLYEYDFNITVESRYSPKKYNLYLHPNKSAYQSLNIGGFEYDVNKIVFAEDFNGKLAGSELDQTILTTIVYGQTYESLPVLNAFKLISDESVHVYKFLGWFDQANVTIDGDNILRGQKYDKSIEVTANPVLNLYAHFEREVYRVSLSHNDGVQINQNIVQPFVKINYDGSSKNGFKKRYSTADEEGFDKFLPKSELSYEMFDLRNETLTLNTFISSQFYISQIIVTFFGESQNLTYVYNGTWQNSDANSYSISGDTNDRVRIIANDFDVSIQLLDMNANHELNQLLYASIEIQTQVKQFANVFEIEGGANVSRNGFNSNAGLIDNSLMLGEEVVYVVEPNQYLLEPNQVLGSYLKTLTIDLAKIDFQLLYDKELPNYAYNNMLHTTYPFVSKNEAGGKVVYQFEIDDITLILEFDIQNQTYAYRLQESVSKNHNIKLVFEEVKNNVQFSFVNEYGSFDESQIDANVIIKNNEGTSSSKIQEQNYLYQNMIASDSIQFRVSLNDGWLYKNIDSIKINYAGKNFYVALFEDIIEKTKIRQNLTLLDDEQFSSSENQMLMIGTGINVVYEDSTNSFLFTVEHIVHDIQIEITYLPYAIVNVYAPLNSYSISARPIGSSLTLFSELINNDNTNYQHKVSGLDNEFVIYGGYGRVEEIVIETSKPENRNYRITDFDGANLSGIQVSEDKTLAKIYPSKSYVATLRVEELTNIFEVKSLLGRGGDNYASDPISSEFGILSKIESFYYRSNGSISQETFNGSKTIRFYGSYLCFKVYNINGYIFQSAELFATNSQTNILPENDDFNTIKTDENGQYREYIYSLVENTISQESFVFEVYQKAIEYKVKFDFSAWSEVNESVPEISCYYNVWFDIPQNKLQKFGYELIGYNKQKLEGVDLSEEDVQFECGERVKENLSNINNDTITLYAIFKAKSYNIIYNLNDSAYGNGSSPATISQLNSENVIFDHSFGSLAQVSRSGYNFSGWFVSAHGGAEQVVQANKFDKNLIDKFSIKDGQSITLFAQYSAINYNVVIVLNDASYSNGSTFAEGDIRNIKVEYDGEFSLPTLARLGYDFIGYKTKKLSSDEAKINEIEYIGKGPAGKTKTKLSYDISSRESGYGLEISDENKSINLYAVYIAKQFNAYINLNIQELLGYGDDDFIFEVYQGQDLILSAKQPYTTVCALVEFDKAFGSLFEVKNSGYSFNGWYVSQEFDLENASAIGRINEQTVLDKFLFDNLVYVSETHAQTPLSENYDQGKFEFTIFAHYSYKILNASLKNGEVSHHIESLQEFETYDHLLIKNTDIFESVAFKYMDDIIFDLWSPEGYFINKIDLIYILNGTEKVISIDFEFDSANHKILIKNREDSEEFVLINGKLEKVFNAFYVKVLPYNMNGEDSGNVAFDTSRIILGIKNAKQDVKIRVSQQIQKYNMSVYSYAKGQNGLEDHIGKIEERQIDYSKTLSTQSLEYPYFPGYKFNSFHYANNQNGTLEILELISLNEPIKSDINVVALYDVSFMQRVNFFVFDTVTKTYVARPDSSMYLMFYYDELTNTWKEGENAGNMFDLSSFKDGKIWNGGGKLIKLPTVGSEIWPENTTLVSYVIASSAPSNGKYFSNFDGENSVNIKSLGLQTFDCSVRVEEELNVYAVYNPPLFEISATANAQNVLLDSDIALYQIFNGVVYELQKTDVSYLSLTKEEFDILMLQLEAHDSLETAIRTAINGNLQKAKKVSSASQKVEFEEIGEHRYYFGVVIGVDENGVEFIYKVSQNYIEYTSNTFTSINI